MADSFASGNFKARGKVSKLCGPTYSTYHLVRLEYSANKKLLISILFEYSALPSLKQTGAFPM